MTEKKLFLLDAMALIYRAYFAMNKNPRYNSKGLNTSAILGFANTLTDIIQNEKPTHIGVAFDLMAPTVRHEDYIEYKANRQATPEDIVNSIPYIKELIEAYNIPILSLEGYEADDIIGTIAKKTEKLGFTTYMMTTDKDFGQLVSEKTFIYKPSRMGNSAEIWGIQEVLNKFGIKRPEQVIDFLGLAGDASDNIPGIPGVGDVTAKKLLEEFDNVENLLEKCHEIKNVKLKEKVEANKHLALQSKQLATIILDVPIQWDEKMLELKPFNTERLKRLLDEMEFKTFAQRVLQNTPVKKAQKNEQISLFDDMLDTTAQVSKANEHLNTISNSNYKLVEREEDINQLIKKLEKCNAFCFDCETTGLNTIDAEIIGIAFSVQENEAFFLYLPQEIEKAKTIINKFKFLFEDEKTAKIGQNLKFDISILRNYSIFVKGTLFDTMLIHYLIEPDLRHNLDYLAETYFEYKTITFNEMSGTKNKENINLRAINKDTLKDYACEDADITLRLKNYLLPELEKKGVKELYFNIEAPLIEVLIEMERNGVKIDDKALEKYSEELKNDINEIEKSIYSLAGTTFNIASPKQMGEILFEKIKIVEKPKRTKTKQYSTSEDVLIKLADKHPIINLILDHRSLTKLKSTYIDALPQLINQKTKLIHASFNQAIASTGRLSSNNPNLQNIPIRTDKGKEIRKSFVPREENNIILSADYSQIEIRIIASISKDEGLIEAFNQKLDVHTATAAKIFDTQIENVNKEMRRKAKTVNFGIIYGISPFGLAERLNISRKEAEDIINQYFNKYPKIKEYMTKTIAFAKENGYVETIKGRRRYIKDINSQNATIRGFAERNAINAPIQGTAADMIKIAMINIHNEMMRLNLKSKMILQVHDELVFDLPKDEEIVLRQIIATQMQEAIKLNVPVEVEINSGHNWLDAH